MKLAIVEMIDNAESTGDWSELEAAQEWTISDIMDAIHADAE